ncbi:MAG: membrane-bound inhibitor of C-type lysozyme [Reinekea sp.]|uniref:MliC family protein n=2 Tax=Reinekea sp. TaxID=1970455 RepID=UPI0039898646
MKFLLLFTLVPTVLLVGCVNLKQGQASKTMKYNLHTYQCESGEVVSAVYPLADKAAVKYKGNNYNLTIAVSASGSRYVGEGLEWWSKGTGEASEGALFKHLEDGTTGNSLESCTKK